MSLKDRLGRLGPPQRLRPGADIRAGGEVSDPAEAEATSPGAWDALRSKMSALLGEESEAGNTTTALKGLTSDKNTSLPFTQVSCSAGTFLERKEPQNHEAAVGRITLSSAGGADMTVLSLLALEPALSSLEARSALYLDTETTGLGGAGTFAFLVGLGWFDEEGRFVLEQLLVRSLSEELALLERIRERMAKCSHLVSFNGKSFDLPLLQGRVVMNRREPLPPRPHLDLLHVARRLHKHRLEQCRLKVLEQEVLGWDRGDEDIPGEEIPARFHHYLRTGDETALSAIVRHNAYDVLTMAALVGLYGEPFAQIGRADLLSLSDAFKRAGALTEATRAVEMAILSGEELEGRKRRAKIHQARGDKARALADFAALSAEVDDPLVRLALVKLLEHFEHDFEQALLVLEGGTGEGTEASAKRKTRLLRRLSRAEPKRG